MPNHQLRTFSLPGVHSSEETSVPILISSFRLVEGTASGSPVILLRSKPLILRSDGDVCLIDFVFQMKIVLLIFWHHVQISLKAFFPRRTQFGRDIVPILISSSVEGTASGSPWSYEGASR